MTPVARQTQQAYTTPTASGSGIPTPAGREPVDVEAIKRARPLLTVLEHYGIVTYGAGARRTALCPFHEDHEPSLTIFLDSNRFHCFGCGATGDVIELVERLEGVGFLEAVRRLSTGRISNDLRLRDSPAGNISTRRHAPAPRRLPSAPTASKSARAGADAGDTGDSRYPADLDAGVFPARGALGPPWHPLTLQVVLLTAAAMLYRETLPHAPQASAYLERRGVSPDVACAASLGYADEASGLDRVLAQAPALLPVARRLGLIDARGRDAMHGRLIIPEVRGGLCIWLHGRVLPEIPDGEGVPTPPLTTTETPAGSRHHTAPKYLGCALEKPLLGAGLCDQYGMQSRVTRGLYHGPMRAGVVVVEGSFDLLTFLGWHLPIRCVALIGTFASADQFSHLVELAADGPIWIALDADPSGEAGARRLAQQLASYPHGVGRLLPPFDAKDFAEAATAAGAREHVLRALAARGFGAEVGKTGKTSQSVPEASA